MQSLLPTGLQITISKDLLSRAGEYSDISRCPLATYVIETLSSFSNGQLLLDVGIKHFWVQSPEGIYKYVLRDIFGEEEYIRVRDTGEEFTTRAILAERPIIVSSKLRLS